MSVSVGAQRRVLVAAPLFADAGLRALADAGVPVLRVSSCDADGDAMADAMAQPGVLAVISRTFPITAAAMDGAHGLRLIVKHGAGVDNIDVAAATSRGIPVLRTAGGNARSVAELALGLLLAVARRIDQASAAWRVGQWARSQDGRELAGRSVGIAGFGATGRETATLLAAFGMRVRIWPGRAAPSQAPPAGMSWASSLNELLSGSEVLSLHLPLTAHTRGLIGARELARLPAGAILINVARGGLIDEGALATALNTGHLFGAGLDTTADEPTPAGSALRAATNLVVTPHLGGSTTAALDALALACARHVIAHWRGEPAAWEDCVNPELSPSAPLRMRGAAQTALGR
ncbi:D-isomer specific 2-hydroxyacid dehydrogenase family protein [Hydrogenophaga sp.]|uniref:NAD(P)-dependent oxidoreductase n=1 Tax=Hydrogenophaga sp. TaxID=1904254 RepID=UPI0027191890|nr:NAD(P)-dependent oxidoreductase [Hydrogenophaga sp.]MDO9437913.1 NAD(P)-dependent oxidoreductase [Hydrogenophaga sp.]